MRYLLQSLTSASTLGPGAALVFDSPRRPHFSFQVSWTGAPTAVIVTVEVTVDGVNWSPQQSISSNGTTPPSGTIQSDDLGPIMGIRLTLTQLSGGSSPTVSATLAQIEAVS